MGFADNTKQTHSSRMLSLSNCDHSEGNWGRLLMENVHYDSRVGFPKYKRGRVSAIRDFRPGCGQFAPRISLRPTEEAISNGIVQNSVDQGKSCDAFGDGIRHVYRSPEVLENFDFTVIPRQTIDVESKPEAPVVSSDQVDGLNLLNTTLLKMPCPEAPDTFSNAGDIETLKSSEHERFNVPKDLHNVDISAPVESMVPRHYPSRRKISAVRDFPPLCGRNAPRLIKESANMLASTDNKNFGKQELDVEEEVIETCRCEINGRE